MKTAGILMSMAAILAGVVVAWLEYERDREAEPADSSGPGDPASAPSVRVEDLSRPPDGAAAGGGGHPDRTPAAAARSDGRPSSDDLRRRQGEIESLLARQRFEEAAEIAKDLIATLEAKGVAPSSKVLAATRRLAARASVFQRLLSAIERPDGKPSVKRVRLANGNTIEVVRAEREKGRWVFELANGISYRPAPGAVLTVEEMSDEEIRDFVSAEWRRVRKRLDKVRDPVTLYVRGVQRCYRWGLLEEGLKLLERILDLPDSAIVPRRFAGSDAAAAEREWELAAGRLDAREGEANGGRTAGDRITHDSGSQDVAASRSEILRRVTSLRDEARELYQRGFRSEGGSRDLREARDRLEHAFTLLESLNEGEQKDALARDLGQILSDVVRVSPF